MPDGLIAFVAEDRPQGDRLTIMTVRPDGTGVHKIGRGRGPSWLPHGRRLLFSTAYGGVRGLFTTTAVGRDLRRVDCAACTRGGTPVDPEYFQSEPSPDGDLLVALGVSGFIVQMVDITTGLDGDTVLDPERDLVEDCGAGCESASNPTWSPDGARIAFAAGSPDSGGRICVVRAAGGRPRCVTSGTSDDDPDWSPDGRWIAFDRFVCARQQPGPSRCRGAVFVIRPNGTGLHRVVFEASDPSWAPDGTRIAFVRLGRSGTCDYPTCRQGIATIRLDGTDLRIVSRNPRHYAPEWQPR